MYGRGSRFDNSGFRRFAGTLRPLLLRLLRLSCRPPSTPFLLPVLPLLRLLRLCHRQLRLLQAAPLRPARGVRGLRSEVLIFIFCFVSCNVGLGLGLGLGFWGGGVGSRRKALQQVILHGVVSPERRQGRLAEASGHKPQTLKRTGSGSGV